MLHNKEEALSQLYKLCDNDIQADLLKDLIIRFNCFDEEIYNLILTSIAKYIISLGYPPDETAIVAFAPNHEADSSQVMLQYLKVVMGMEGMPYPITINRFDRISKAYHKQNIRHFIAVDEFIGSGRTIINRNDFFQKLGLTSATIDFCIMAGMNEAIEIVKKEGISLHVEYDIKKGISQYYNGDKLITYTEEMRKLEAKLAKKINGTLLTDYNFGFGRAESLFTTLHGNIPNNVFPVFWWKIDSNQNKRVTLFTRVQDGY